MRPTRPNELWNRYGHDGDLMTDETGNVVHVRHKTQALSAAQKAERVNLEQRRLLVDLHRALDEGAAFEALAKLQAYHRTIYPGELYEKVLGEVEA